jgi:transcriptional regulator of acetoin/glycerol metabolism
MDNRRAMPSPTSFVTDALVPLLIYENDSLEAFLDRSFISLYDQLVARAGSHSQAARLLGIDRTGLYQRLERARRRLQRRASA